MPAPKVGDEELKEILDQLTELEGNFCRVLAYNPRLSQTAAIRQAGSKANGHNATKLASDMIKRPHVQKYLEYLRKQVAEQSGIELSEIINNARKAIELSFASGKPRDVEPHNRLLAELGGFIKVTGQQTANTQVNVSIEDSSLKSDELDADRIRLLTIAGLEH